MHCRVKPHDNVKMSLTFGRSFIKSVTDVGYSGDHSYDFGVHQYTCLTDVEAWIH